MQTSTNIMDKDQLIKLYVKEIVDGMDLNDCLALYNDAYIETYSKYSDEEVKEELNEYYPHLLDE